MTLPEEMISVVDLASQCGERKQTVFEVVRRLNIEPRKLRSAGRRGQLVSYVTAKESDLIVAELRSGGHASKYDEEVEASVEALPDEHGVFYLLLLELEHDPGRFKVGFAVSPPERLRTLRCSAPFANVVRSWPCKKLWERTAIDCVPARGQQLHTEVFRTESIEPVIQRCEQFFGLMPNFRE